MPADPRRLKDLFGSAAAIADPSERAAYLDRECDDADLRRRLDALLRAHDRPESALERPLAVPDPNRTVDRPSAAVGSVVAGRYKLLEAIGEGGMGEVWVADQLEPVKRRVALKMIKPGMDSRSILARFEAERQALAMMDHPNIAKVFDASTTEDGRPYFVMELVKGTPITEFCDARKLGFRERLELFVPVCQAIQHAHMKGIIHRDIKPTNVLVALHDETPVAKVIDFGVAKAIGQQLTDKTLYTGFGTLVGTPAYMAPEQATFNQLDIDTRADVYALGVLLYELLAGSPPIEKERLKLAALDEVLRIVRDEEPQRPSQRLSTSQAKATIAATRKSDAAKLSQLMKGELDWIVMKALEKDRTRRYDTANGLAKDVQRYLAGDAVEACPPTLAYRLRKAYRRNRKAVLVGLTFTLLLLTGVAAATLLAIQARRAEALAEIKRSEAEEQTKKAERLFATNSSLQEVYLEAAVEAEIRNSGSRLDADLLEYRSDPRVGLLRLARPLKSGIGPIKSDFPLPGAEHWMGFEDDLEMVRLRQFQTAAVIAAGQEFVPLVPPFVMDTIPSAYMVDLCVSPDGRLSIAGKEQRGLELLVIPSLKRLGVLREGTERVLQYGFSPDSQTAWTQDSDSVVRFWNTDGTLRAKTPLRPERFVYPAGMTHDEIRRVVELANSCFVVDRIALVQSEQRVGIKPGETLGKDGPRGSIDVYDTRTGAFIRRLDWVPRRQAYMRYDWKLSPDKQWIYATKGSQIVVLSTTDGRELARLDHPGPKEPHLVSEASPTGKWLLTHHFLGETDRNNRSKLWDTSTWQAVTDPTLVEWIGRNGANSFLTDDILEITGVGEVGGEGSLDGAFFRISQPGPSVPFSAFGYSGVVRESPAGELGGKLIRYQRILTDADTLKRLKPPPGRKYAAEFAKLAPDGRFWENLDTVTEKDLPFSIEGTHFPGFGRVMFRFFGNGGDEEPNRWQFFDEAELRILPDAKRLDFPPELVELWAKVVVGGELSPEGTFQPWDQPTWSAKQRVLAAAKPPYADFPFPGWAASEPNLRYRIQANRMKTGPERDKLLEQWRQTQPPRPNLGPDTWRTREVAPPPREPKK